MLDNCGFSAALLDGGFRCIYSNDGTVPDGRVLSEMTVDKFGISAPLRKSVNVGIERGGTLYNARILPLDENLFGECLYLCELMNETDILDISSKTEIPGKVLQAVGMIETQFSDMWGAIDEFQNHPEFQGCDESLIYFSEIKDAVCGIQRITKNITELYNIIYGGANLCVVDIGKLINVMIAYCNSILSKCGRKIRLLSEEGNFSVVADERSIIAAVINAVQNSLLYSPSESIPVVSLLNQRNDNFVRISFVNSNVKFKTDNERKDSDSKNKFARLGMGNQIIDSFVKKVGGSVERESSEGKTVVSISLPKWDGRGEYPMREISSETFVKMGSPSYVEIKMLEVVMTELRVRAFSDSDE
jgi:two-component sensor histidine kinase